MKRLVLPLALIVVFAFAKPFIADDVAARGGGAPDRRGAGAPGHVKPLPAFVAKREKERIEAADLVARGLATPDANGIVTLKNGRFVDYKLQGTEYLTAVLIDFTDIQHAQIPQPDRSIDNSTYWSADVSPQHYSDLLFAPGGGSYGDVATTPHL